MQLKDLVAGAEFVTGSGRRGRLIRVMPGSVLVELERVRKRAFQTKAGREVHFTRRVERTRLAPGAEVKRV